MSEVTITPSQIPEFLKESIKHRFTCLFTGLPGIGKTEIVNAVGRELLGNTKEIRTSQLDPVDVMGVPSVIDGFTRFAIPELLPNVERDGKTGLCILDEALDGTTAVLTAIQQLILEHRVGSYVLPEGWHIVAMGNKKEHGGINRGLSQPLKDRFAHGEVIVDERILPWMSKVNSTVKFKVKSKVKLKVKLRSEIENELKIWKMPGSKTDGGIAHLHLQNGWFGAGP